VCDLETSRMRETWPALGRSATGQKMVTDIFKDRCAMVSRTSQSKKSGYFFLDYYTLNFEAI